MKKAAQNVFASLFGGLLFFVLTVFLDWAITGRAYHSPFRSSLVLALSVVIWLMYSGLAGLWVITLRKDGSVLSRGLVSRIAKSFAASFLMIAFPLTAMWLASEARMADCNVPMFVMLWIMLSGVAFENTFNPNKKSTAKENQEVNSNE